MNDEPTPSTVEPVSEKLKNWVEPTLLKLEAGAAEAKALYGPDGAALTS